MFSLLADLESIPQLLALHIGTILKSIAGNRFRQWAREEVTSVFCHWMAIFTRLEEWQTSGLVRTLQKFTTSEDSDGEKDLSCLLREVSTGQ